MGSWWEPVTEELLTLCAGRPRLFTLLVFLCARTHARDGGFDNAGHGSMLDEYRRLYGVSRTTLKLDLAALERLPGVRVDRRPNGPIVGVRTEAYARWLSGGESRGRNLAPSAEFTDGGGGRNPAPRGSKSDPLGAGIRPLGAKTAPPLVSPPEDLQKRSAASEGPPPTPEGPETGPLGGQIEGRARPVGHVGNPPSPPRAQTPPAQAAEGLDDHAPRGSAAAIAGALPAALEELAALVRPDPETDPAGYREWRRKRPSESFPDWLARTSSPKVSA